MKNIKTVASLLLVVVSVVWGTTFFVVKGTVQRVDPYLLVFIRSALASIPLLAWVAMRKPKELIKWANIRNGAILGLLLATVYASQTIGLQYTSSGHSAFITGSTVVLVPVVMYFAYKYRFTVQNIAAIGVVTYGLFLMTYDTGTHVNIGDLITLITAASGALLIALTGVYVQKHDVMALVSYQFFFSGVFNLAVYLWHKPLQFAFDAPTWWALIYLAFIGTLFCYASSSWAQKYVDPVLAALIFSLEPLFAVLFSYWFGGETLTNKEILGAVLILLGIVYYELPWAKMLRKLTPKQKYTGRP